MEQKNFISFQGHAITPKLMADILTLLEKQQKEMVQLIKENYDEIMSIGLVTKNKGDKWVFTHYEVDYDNRNLEWLQESIVDAYTRIPIIPQIKTHFIGEKGREHAHKQAEQLLKDI